jgi:hypothetical protein
MEIGHKTVNSPSDNNPRKLRSTQIVNGNILKLMPQVVQNVLVGKVQKHSY